VRKEIETTLLALGEASKRLDEERRQWIQEARAGVVGLAIEIAKKIIKREIKVDPQVILGNVEAAVEQIFGGGDVVLQLHPEDTGPVEQVLRNGPRWAEDVSHIAIRPAPELDRGGCRLLSGTSVVDLTVESQLDLIEDALLRMVADDDETESGRAPGEGEGSL
jgi:flagellar assembly protein FliH